MAKAAGAGISSGINIALTVAAKFCGEATARQIQLFGEYDPQPPLDGNSQDKTNPETVENLRTYGNLAVFQPARSEGKEENAGFDAIVPLIDCGTSGYFWTAQNFLSVVFYSCKGFDTDDAILHSRQIFGVEGEIAARSF